MKTDMRNGLICGALLGVVTAYKSYNDRPFSSFSSEMGTSWIIQAMTTILMGMLIGAGVVKFLRWRSKGR